MGEKLKSATNGRKFRWLEESEMLNFDANGVEVRKWGTSGVLFFLHQWGRIISLGLINKEMVCCDLYLIGCSSGDCC